MIRLRVVGVGTHHGDDAVGLVVAGEVERVGPADTVVVRCVRPVELADALTRADGVVIVDATRTGAPPGTVRRLPRHGLERGSGVSSHGFGVREGLELAEALGLLPGTVVIVGVEATGVRGQGLSHAVRAAVDDATRLVLETLDAMRLATPERVPSPPPSEPPAPR